VPKIKDLVNTSNNKYKNIFDTISNTNNNSNTNSNTNNNSNTNSNNNNSYTQIDLLPIDLLSMKDELKMFLKTQPQPNINETTDVSSFMQSDSFSIF
jgi:hypothetical protein